MAQIQDERGGKESGGLGARGRDFGRPYVMPPNTPPQQVKIIRDAFEKTLSGRV